MHAPLGDDNGHAAVKHLSVQMRWPIQSKYKSKTKFPCLHGKPAKGFAPDKIDLMVEINARSPASER